VAITIQFFGAAGEVTGSCHLVTVGDQQILLDCGLIQGGRMDEDRNRNPFPFDPKTIDAVILSHAHIDHSGRLPMLVKAGFDGPIYTHSASRDLCDVMLSDAGFISEKDAEWENRKRERKGLELIEPLFTVDDAKFAMNSFKGLNYGEKHHISPNISLCLSDAGHILGSSIVELWLEDSGDIYKIVFSGDLGRSGMPVLKDPSIIPQADLVIMESTYGDRLHRSWEDTQEEIRAVLKEATQSNGNILMPAFSVGRTQEILYLFAKYYDEWELDRWHIFLDSPMAIEATRVFTEHTDLFDTETAALWRQHEQNNLLPNLHISRTSSESMAINRIENGAIIIAGSGMCTGGRIKHHLKHNIWRKKTHLVITGFQARGTLGRKLVEGAKHIRLWGETIRVAARIHTLGGLSAHADQTTLCNWYDHFKGRPTVILVHGEKEAAAGLSERLTKDLLAPVHTARLGEKFSLSAGGIKLIDKNST